MSETSSNLSTTIAHSPSSTVSHGMDDIQYLLYLESLRRFREDEANIKRQVEEKTRHYLEVKNEYLKLYAQYTELIKAASIQCAQAAEHNLHSAQVAAAKEVAVRITEKLASDDLVDELDSAVVEECKQKLKNAEPHETLKQLKQELSENKSNVKAVQTAIETVETIIETATLQGLDHFVDEVSVLQL